MMRRSTRERKQPKAIYEVEDRRVAEEEEGDGADLEERGDTDANSDAESSEGDNDGDDFEPAPRKSATRASPSPKKRIATPKKPTRKSPLKPRKLKPVQEERTPQKRKAGDAAGGDQDVGEPDDDGEDEVFFETVARGKCSMTDLVVEWRQRYEVDAEAATREVLNFVLQSCGGEGQCVPPTTRLEKLDLGDLVDFVVQDLEKANDGYPMLSKNRAFKKFHQHFVDFWQAFIQECYDSELMFTALVVDQFVDWLTTLSSAEVRAIRHTTTVATYAVGNAMVECITKLTQQLSVVQRQLNAESSSKRSTPTKASPGDNAVSKKLTQLKENKAMYQERQAKLLELVQLLFNGVVVHRYRDVMPEIRAESISVLGNWIAVLPQHFLKDNYLKYLGWVLNDKDAQVRVEVVEILRRLYENEELAEKMELFTTRFLSRFLELCNDVDDGVVEECIKLLIAVDKRSLISSEVELHSVERLVFDETNEVIRKAAAEFVCLQYDAFGVAESNRNVKLTKDQLNTQAIALVEFAEEYITNHHVPAEAVETMVDAFWGLDDCQVLQDWKLLTGLLLTDKNAPDLSSEQQTLLIRILVASIRKLTAVDSDKSTAAAKKKFAKEKDELCLTFCREIPSMLVRFQSDVEKLALLVDLIPLTLNGQVSDLQPNHVKALLQKLQQAYTTHAELDLLKSLSLSMHHLRESDHEVIKRESEVVVHELVHDVLEKLEEALEEDEKLSAQIEASTPTKKSKRRNSKKRDITDSEYAVRTAVVRLQCLISHVCVRDYLVQAQPVVTSKRGGKRKSSQESEVPETSALNRMDTVASGLVSFIRRRTTAVASLDPALLEAHSLKFALRVLFSDILWLTRPVFSMGEEQARNDAEPPTGELISRVDKAVEGRALLEEAIVCVLEMHLRKVHKPRGEDDEDDAAAVEMEEIEFEDPKVAMFVKEAQRAAFLTFCDARCLFVEKFKDAPAPFNRLDWPLSKVLVLLTQMYFENEMETPTQPEVEGEAESEEAIKAINVAEQAKAEILVALGRVSQSNPSNKRQAAAVLRYLVDGGPDSQEVVRAFSKHIKAEAPVRYLEVQMTALRQVHATILGLKEEYETTEAEDDASTREELEASILESEAEIKELAKKLSQTLGVGRIAASIRAPFFRFLCEGVRYALERPAQFTFLDVLRPYLSHLDKASTKQLHSHFKQLLADHGDDVPTDPADIDQQWQLVFDFQSLIVGAKSNGTVSKALKRKSKPSAEDAPNQLDEELRSIPENDEPETPVLQQGPRGLQDVVESPAPRAPPQESSRGAKNAVRASSAKRKLIHDNTSPSPQKRSRSTARLSTGRITQLSDDEDQDSDAGAADQDDAMEGVQDQETSHDEAPRPAKRRRGAE